MDPSAPRLDAVSGFLRLLRGMRVPTPREVLTLWQGKPLTPLEKDPLGLLCVEGFAQRLEGVILGSDCMHEAQDDEWLSLCQVHLAHLARAYEDRARRGEKVNEFFGSWPDFQGVPFLGCFFGHAAIRILEEQTGLQELAQAPPARVRQAVVQVLGRFDGPSPHGGGPTQLSRWG